jgi:hypothetical protein
MKYEVKEYKEWSECHFPDWWETFLKKEAPDDFLAFKKLALDFIVPQITGFEV